MQPPNDQNDLALYTVMKLGNTQLLGAINLGLSTAALAAWLVFSPPRQEPAQPDEVGRLIIETPQLPPVKAEDPPQESTWLPYDPDLDPGFEWMSKGELESTFTLEALKLNPEF